MTLLPFVAAMAIVTVSPAGATAGAESVLIDRCDRLAAAPFDGDRPAAVSPTELSSIDTAQAVSVCEEAVKANPDQRRVQFELGRALDAARRFGEAKLHYEIAAKAGSASAMTNIGALFEEGHGVQQDYTAALDWFKRAAVAGNARALTALGSVYYLGHGVATDYSASKIWLEKAAAAGDPAGMFNLATQYERGEGVPQDYAEARHWLEKAATAGLTTAMVDLGTLDYKGFGKAPDFDGARSWYEKAAAAGDGRAMFYLAGLYSRGNGVERNERSARSWLERAAIAGNADAKAALLSRSCNDSIHALFRGDVSELVRLAELQNSSHQTLDDALQEFHKLTHFITDYGKGAPIKLTQVASESYKSAQVEISLWSFKDGRQIYAGCVNYVDASGHNIEIMRLATGLGALRNVLDKYLLDKPSPN